MDVAAVIFDLDGVLIDSEAAWSRAREQITREHGGRWHEGAQREMMGMSSLEWSRYMHERLGVELAPDEISRETVRRLEQLYRKRLPLIDGAVAAVRRLARRWRLGLATSANRELIGLVLELAGLSDCFAASVSSEEVARGKPAADVYLEAARRLGVEPAAGVAVEDSTNGLLAARTAGMGVVAVPNRDYPPEPRGLAAADVVLDSIAQLDEAAVERAAASRAGAGAR